MELAHSVNGRVSVRYTDVCKTLKLSAKEAKEKLSFFYGSLQGDTPENAYFTYNPPKKTPVLYLERNGILALLLICNASRSRKLFSIEKYIRFYRPEETRKGSPLIVWMERFESDLTIAQSSITKHGDIKMIEFFHMATMLVLSADDITGHHVFLKEERNKMYIHRESPESLIYLTAEGVEYLISRHRCKVPRKCIMISHLIA